MSYTPNTWTTGDTITATKLNNIEQGIANAGGGGSVVRVVVDFNGGGFEGTTVCYVGNAIYNETLQGYSIESPLTEYISGTPTARMYIPVCLPSEDDGFKVFIYFDYSIHNVAGYNVTGDISSTIVTGQMRQGASSWNSESYYGLEVTGDGEIEVYYSD